MVFQFYGGYRSGYGSGGMFSNFVYYLDYWGVRDIILPFILIFTIFFAVLQKIHLFGAGDKKYNVALSLAIALLVIVPHATGMYPPEGDVVNIINDSIPEVALLVIVVVLLLMMLGLIGGAAPQKTMFTSVLALVAVGVLVCIFLNSIFPLPIIMYLDPSIQALIVILLVFGLIVWFVTREEPTQKTSLAQMMWEEMSGGKKEEKKP